VAATVAEAGVVDLVLAARSPAEPESNVLVMLLSTSSTGDVVVSSWEVGPIVGDVEGPRCVVKPLGRDDFLRVKNFVIS
jgi:hypothetical protein